MVNFVLALAYHYWLNLPVAFTQPGARLLVEPCSLFMMLPEWTGNELHLVNLEPVAVEQGLGRAVAAPQPGLFGQGQLQLYRRAARHPRPEKYKVKVD